MTEDEYGLRSVEGIRTMVDIGGYLGGVGIGVALDHRDALVWIVEPLTANVALIERNVAENELGDRVTVVAAAAAKPGQRKAVIRWAFDDTESGRHHRFVGNSTLAAPEGARQELAPCVSLGELVGYAGGRLDLLKIDCEGAEYDILADAEALADVGLIVGEYHTGYAPLAALLDRTHHVVRLSGDDNIGEFRADPR